MLYIIMILFGSIFSYGGDLTSLQEEWNRTQNIISAISESIDKERLYNLYALTTCVEPCHMQAIVEHMKEMLEKNHHKIERDDEVKNITESLKNLEDFVINKAPREQETLQQFFNKVSITYIPRDVYISGLLRVDSNVSIGGDLTVTGSISNPGLVNAVSNSGPSQDNALARFDGTSGKLIQNSALIGTDFTTATQNNVAIRADDGSTANITLALVPKGSGALAAAIPDGAAGGNARGLNAVDLQTIRATPMDVASGAYATISGGNSNRSAGDYSFAAGRRAKSDDQGSFTWADSTDADFTSNGINTFNVRANGGAYIFGDLYVTGSLLASNVSTGSSTGNVSNFGTSQDKAIARFNGTSGTVIQNSALIATDFTALTQNNVGIRADDGTTTHITLALVPKGDGAIVTAIPNGIASGGNARGIKAVDLQIQRAAAAQVAAGPYSVIGGGLNNSIDTTNQVGTIAGGNGNSIIGSNNATISGGTNNSINTSQSSSIAGGSSNAITNAINACVAGGNSNACGGDYSFAAGRRAKANQQGAFVWADSTNADFNSAGINTFNVRATGGMFLTGDLTLTGTITSAGSGLVQSSGASQDNAIARFNGTSGNVIQSSALIATDYTTATQNNVAIRADDGATADITLALVPKGTGALTTAIPDGGSGGNARGNNAVDLQTARTNPSGVAAATASTISGGSGNAISSASNSSVISGGSGNTMFNTSTGSSIAGGLFNQIDNSINAAISGGTSNAIQGSSNSSAIGGGNSNLISASSGSFIAGGNNNAISSAPFSFAAGRRSKANHQGTFVWADSTNADFATTTQDTFNVRATNGGFFSNNLTFNNSAALPLNAVGAGSETGLRIIRGLVTGNSSGPGWTSTNTGTGTTQILWTTPFTTPPSIVVLPTTGAITNYVANVVTQATGAATIAIRRIDTNAFESRNYNFIAIGN